VHRATLYRRLARVEELAGLDLARGDDRLHAHLAVRMWRLAGSPVLG
jgi:DNA-binding PucR family transcriptional regulator